MRWRRQPPWATASSAKVSTGPHSRRPAVHFCAPACCGRLLDGRRDSSGALTRQSAPAGLKKFLKKNVDAETDTLAVLDAKLGGIVKEKMGIQCINK
jgi:hypothetical protein